MVSNNALNQPRYAGTGRLRRRSRSREEGGFLFRQETLASYLVDKDQLDLPLHKRRIFWFFIILMSACLVSSGVGLATYAANRPQILADIPPPLHAVIGTEDECTFYPPCPG
mmetsp:Transcript_16738/g.20652  ORF Transcript_16738/g.20652 Transcript_16738/m.20652 type:complete len:112 (-) Transcript_16738:455-790(-)